MFVGREREIADLDQAFKNDKACLAIVYGRRRIGKSTLLQHVAKQHGRHIYFQATKIDDSMNIAALKSEIVKAIGADPILDGISDWLGLLHYLAKAAEKHRNLVVIIDEFPYLLDSKGTLPSIIQKFWDTGAAELGNLKLVLCGSLISHMEGLLSERNPLFGRKTLALSLEPMSLREAVQFMPEYTATDQITAYAIFGGIPHYLQMCDQSVPLKTNVKNILLTKTGALFEEPDYLLQSELQEPRRYASIIAAIASGATKLGEVVSRIQGMKDTTQITPYLDPLIRMRIIEKVRSLDASEHARDNRYYVSDPLFRFWYRFVLPNISAVTSGFGDDVYDRVISPHLSEYMGLAFEQICREHVRLHAQEHFAVPASEIGKIWGADFDIDIAGRLLDQSTVFGECKWDNTLLSESVHELLTQNISKSKFVTTGKTKHSIYFSRKGFTSGLKKLAEIDAGICLVSAAELVRSPTHDWTPHP